HMSKIISYSYMNQYLIEAASKADGLAVLGGFIGVKGKKLITIPGFNVRHLLPDSLDRFYRYNGSLTTPPCFQTVSWTVFNDSIRVSRRQVRLFSREHHDTLKTEHNMLLSKNFRAPQLLHGRKVLASFHTESTTGGMYNLYYTF
uniref:Alpha-carbonic anhydrase domain-containing protein n=1 Tax=Cyprinus carpio TaxID=7962 RepID=A0A8C2CZP0_CYPCA